MQIKLDFNINGGTARLDYLKDYLEEVDSSRLTQDNLEMMSNYVLWGVEADDPSQNFEIESKNSPWTKGKATTSFEALMEQEQETGMSVHAQIAEGPTFNPKRKLERAPLVQKLKEGNASSYWEVAREMISNPDIPLITLYEDLISSGKIKRETPLLDISTWHPMTINWFNLWGQIDLTEFQLQTWELTRGKRRADLPIREELHFRLACYFLWTKGLTEPQVSLNDFESVLAESCVDWTGYEALRKKRSLVSLRTQQYSLLDCFQGESMLPVNANLNFWREEERGIQEVYPFSDPKLIITAVSPSHFQGQFYDLCTKALRELDEVDNHVKPHAHNSVDFRSAEDVRQMVLAYMDLVDAAERSSYADVMIRNLVAYLNYYIDQCQFSEELQTILRMKIARASNKEIAETLKRNFNLSYKENYISTIFTKRIIEEIVEQVNTHYHLLEYITMGPNVFKRCAKCGKLLPRNSTYFNKRTSTSDGFFTVCKKCRKE